MAKFELTSAPFRSVTWRIICQVLQGVGEVVVDFERGLERVARDPPFWSRRMSTLAQTEV